METPTSPEWTKKKHLLLPLQLVKTCGMVGSFVIALLIISLFCCGFNLNLVFYYLKAKVLATTFSKIVYSQSAICARNLKLVWNNEGWFSLVTDNLHVSYAVVMSTQNRGKIITLCFVTKWYLSETFESLFSSIRLIEMIKVFDTWIYV